MIPRAIAFALIVLMMIAGLAASEHKATNNGLPLVHAALPAWKPASPADQMLFAPCPISPRNLPLRNQRSA